MPGPGPPAAPRTRRTPTGHRGRDPGPPGVREEPGAGSSRSSQLAAAASSLPTTGLSTLRLSGLRGAGGGGRSRSRERRNNAQRKTTQCSMQRTTSRSKKQLRYGTHGHLYRRIRARAEFGIRTPPRRRRPPRVITHTRYIQTQARCLGYRLGVSFAAPSLHAPSNSTV